MYSYRGYVTATRICALNMIKCLVHHGHTMLNKGITRSPASPELGPHGVTGLPTPLHHSDVKDGTQAILPSLQRISFANNRAHFGQYLRQAGQ